MLQKNITAGQVLSDSSCSITFTDVRESFKVASQFALRRQTQLLIESIFCINEWVANYSQAVSFVVCFHVFKIVSQSLAL